ncbi:MAG TPA: right-handed parallel beta-helix repeat-containing protein [Thermoanaerobaculia bacterium]|nr:right-handed parallel beta-helix repeat-containing protein [Thermoanaerobaculia bacterium]
MTRKLSAVSKLGFVLFAFIILPTRSSAYEKELMEVDGTYLSSRYLPALTKKNFLFSPIQVRDAEGKTYTIDQISFKDPASAQPIAKWALASVLTLDGNPFISFSEAMKASRPGSTIQLSPGASYLHSMVVLPYMPKESPDLRKFILGRSDIHSYSEYYVAREAIWIHHAPLKEVTIMGASDPGSTDLRRLMEIGAFRSARSTLHKFLDLTVTKDARTLAVPTIKSLEPAAGGYALDRENLSLDRRSKDIILPIPESVIRIDRNSPLVISKSQKVKFKNVGFVGSAMGMMTTSVDFTSSDPLVYINGADSIEFENCAFINSVGAGVLIINSKNIRFKNCVFGASIRHAIMAINSDVAITGSVFVGNGRGWRNEDNSKANVIEPGSSILATSSLILLSGNYFKGSGRNAVLIDDTSDMLMRSTVIDDESGATFEDCERRASQITGNIGLGRVIDGGAVVNFSSLGRRLDKHPGSRACVNLEQESNRNGTGRLEIDTAASLISSAVDFSEAERKQALATYQVAQEQYYARRNPDGKIWLALLACSTEYFVGQQISDPIVASAVSQMIATRLETRVGSGDLTQALLENAIVEALRESGYEGLAKAAEFGIFLKCIDDRS